MSVHLCSDARIPKALAVIQVGRGIIEIDRKLATLKGLRHRAITLHTPNVLDLNTKKGKSHTFVDRRRGRRLTAKN